MRFLYADIFYLCSAILMNLMKQPFLLCLCLMSFGVFAQDTWVAPVEAKEIINPYSGNQIAANGVSYTGSGGSGPTGPVNGAGGAGIVMIRYLSS